MHTIERIVRWIAVDCARVLLGVLILAGIAINFANVVGRYVFFAPIVWAEEVLAYIMVWCVFIGAVPVMWEGRHIKMDLIAAAVRGRARIALNTITALGIVLVCVFVIMQSWPFVSMLIETDQRSVILRLPMGLMNTALLLGFIGILLVVLVRLRTFVRGNIETDTEAAVRQAIDSYGTARPADPRRTN
ncbi:MAG: TRAP transporter small permease [Burkholderiales bacterium]